MQKQWLAGWVILVLAGMGGMAAAAENQVANPGFEKGSEQGIDEWNLDRRAWSGGAVAKLDAAEHHAGEKSMLLEVPQALKTGEKAYVLVTQEIPVEAGKSYNLRYWYKSQGLLKEDRAYPTRGYAHLAVWIFWFDQNHRPVASGPKNAWVSNEGRDAKEWVKVENTRHAQAGAGTPFRAPEGATTAMIRLQLTTTAEGITPKVWLDDVEFEEAGQ